MGDGFRNAINAAALLIGPDVNVRDSEYARGQIELIRELHGLNMEADDSREYIAMMIDAEIFRIGATEWN